MTEPYSSRGSAKLLPCPFCGAPAEMTRFKSGTSTLPIQITQIQCGNDDNCGVCVDIQHINEAVAIKAWNTRTSPPSPDTGRPDPNTVADSSGMNPGAIGASKEAGATTGFATVASASNISDAGRPDAELVALADRIEDSKSLSIIEDVLNHHDSHFPHTEANSELSPDDKSSIVAALRSASMPVAESDWHKDFQTRTRALGAGVGREDGK